MRVGVVCGDDDGAMQVAFECAARSLMDLEVIGYYRKLDDSADCRSRRSQTKMRALERP